MLVFIGLCEAPATFNKDLKTCWWWVETHGRFRQPHPPLGCLVPGLSQHTLTSEGPKAEQRAASILGAERCPLFSATHTRKHDEGVHADLHLLGNCLLIN